MLMRITTDVIIVKKTHANPSNPTIPYHKTMSGVARSHPDRWFTGSAQELD